MGYLKSLYYRLVLKLYRWSNRQLKNRFKEVEPKILNKVERLILAKSDEMAVEIGRRDAALRAMLQRETP